MLIDRNKCIANDNVYICIYMKQDIITNGYYLIIYIYIYMMCMYMLIIQWFVNSITYMILKLYFILQPFFIVFFLFDLI